MYIHPYQPTFLIIKIIKLTKGSYEPALVACLAIVPIMGPDLLTWPLLATTLVS